MNKDTKKKIIESAIRIFNKEGCVSISMRTIALSCDMSLSNLQHHFKTKDLLLAAIVNEMRLVFDNSSDLDISQISIKILMDMNIKWLEFQRNYKFYFIEISAILQTYPVIQKIYKKTKSKRLDEYDSLFNGFVNAGLFKPEPYSGFFKNQAELLWFKTNFHLSALLAEGHKFNQVTFDHLNKVGANIIFPMLSEKGIAELVRLNTEKLKQ